MGFKWNIKLNYDADDNELTLGLENVSTDQLFTKIKNKLGLKSATTAKWLREINNMSTPKRKIIK